MSRWLPQKSFTKLELLCLPYRFTRNGCSNSKTTRNKATAVRELTGEHKWLKQQHGAKARSTPEVVLLISTTDAAESEQFVVGGDEPRGDAYAIFRTNHGKKWKEAECARDEEKD